MKTMLDKKLSRREAMAAMGVLALSAKLAGAADDVTENKFKGIALQLYTLRVPAKDDLAGTLKKVREMGWEYVQWSGMPDLPAQGIRDALDAAGLKAISAHIGIEGFEQDFEGQVAFWKTVGNTDVAPGGMMGDCKDSLEAWKRGAVRLDAVGAKLREAGMRLSYHNHDSELGKFDGDDRPNWIFSWRNHARQPVRGLTAWSKRAAPGLWNLSANTKTASHDSRKDR